MEARVGIELRIRKLMILLNEKGAKNTQFAQPRYTRVRGSPIRS
jgi:hypothetical protein